MNHGHRSVGKRFFNHGRHGKHGQKKLGAFLLLLGCASLGAQEAGLPLPKAPIRLLIPDAKAFDAMLSAPAREFLSGEASPEDKLVTGLRQSRVGTKLESQWALFSSDLNLDWKAIQKIQASSLGVSLMDVGNMEAVLIIQSPLADFPWTFPKGQSRTHGGVNYQVASKGAADGNEKADRRMGLAWARMSPYFLVASSERSLKLAIDEALAKRSFKASKGLLAAMELDLDILNKDRYFKREFLFNSPSPESGRVRAHLQKEAVGLVEERFGAQEKHEAIFHFAAPGAVSAGWEFSGTPFWPTFRRLILEPIIELKDQPAVALQRLPDVDAGGPHNRYAIRYQKSDAAGKGAPSTGTTSKGATSKGAWEAGDLKAWQAVLEKHPIASWGHWASANGDRRMVFPWPAKADGDFLEACRQTVQRRAGRCTVQKDGPIQDLKIGPGLSTLAVRRTGDFLWVATNAQALKNVESPVAQNDLTRWGNLDLDWVRQEGRRWEKIEGPSRPEYVRPLSDRVLGLLGWAPELKRIGVKRVKTGTEDGNTGWKETVNFELK